MQKKCNDTYLKQQNDNKHHSGAGTFYTSSAGTIVRLINNIWDGSCRRLLPQNFAKANILGVPLRRHHPSCLLTICITIPVLSIISIAGNTNDTYATASTLSLFIDNTTVGLDISSISSTGTFAKSSNSTISASTNNATGYTLSIAGTGSNYDKLINGDASLSSIDNVTTEAQFKALEGTAYNKMWGYLPSKHCTNATDTTTCTINTDFLPAPNNTTGDIIDKTTVANSNNTPNEYTIAIGARVDSTTKIGSYSNVFLVQAVANPITYSIIYNDSTVTNMPEDINTATSMDDEVSVSSNTPVKSGYTFLGWCDGTITTTNNVDSCTGTTYQPNDPYILNQTASTNRLNLNAMWSKAYIQDFTVSQCSTLASDKHYTVYDKRDGNAYTVRYINGKCWMTSNLRFIGTYIESTSTNINTTKTISYNDLSNGNSLTNASIRFGVDNNGDFTVWYNYAAASAMTIAGNSNFNTQTYDLCPKNWRMPSKTEFADIISYSSMFNLVTGGIWYDGNLAFTGVGFWWTSTVNASSGADRYRFRNQGPLDVDGTDKRDRGFYVRCIHN